MKKKRKKEKSKHNRLMGSPTESYERGKPDTPVCLKTLTQSVAHMCMNR